MIVSGASGPTPSRASLLIAALALVVMLPEWVAGPGFTDSFRYNHVWTEQFTAQFAGGDLYPRWLERSWAGLGAPTFYFYPPLFFWIAAVARAASFGTLSAGAAGTLASALVLAGSGWAMRAWLGAHVGQRRASWGAAAYMLAPYHLTDIYCRGAVAEACAYAMLPLVMLGLARGRITLVAAGYAGLLLSHLPVALLASVTAIPCYAVYVALRSGAPAHAISRGLAGGALGVALAAFYWFPALRLLTFISSGALGGAFYRPEIWFFWRPWDWPGGFRMLAIVAISLGALPLAVAGARREGAGRFWAIVTAACVLLLAGAAPWVWRLALLAQVQFPWRLLVVVEFAAISAFAIGGGRIASLLARGGFILLGVGGAMSSMVAAKMIEAGWERGAQARAILSRGMEEAPEYLPAGYPVPLDGQGRADPGNIPLPDMPPVIALDPRARVKAIGEIVAVDSPAPTRIVLRRFYFPRWRAFREAGIEPYGPLRLLSWRAPAGRNRFRLESAPAPGERAGALLSLAALLATLALLVGETRTRFRHRARA